MQTLSFRSSLERKKIIEHFFCRKDLRQPTARQDACDTMDSYLKPLGSLLHHVQVFARPPVLALRGTGTPQHPSKDLVAPQGAAAPWLRITALQASTVQLFEATLSVKLLLAVC